MSLNTGQQERDHDCQLKLKEVELREKKLALKEREMQLQLQLKELEVSKAATPVSTESLPTIAPFDVSRQVRLVPPFQEQEVEQIFLHFEKVAANLHWSAEAKTMLLQSVLVGKAREAYSSLSVEQSSDYEIVKREILKAYELVPEAYLLKFWEMKCKGETFLEFAHQKEALFNRWCTSQQIGNSFEKLTQLILLEEFKSCVPVNIKAYLEEQKVEELHRMTTKSLTKVLALFQTVRMLYTLDLGEILVVLFQMRQAGFPTRHGNKNRLAREEECHYDQVLFEHTVNEEGTCFQSVGL